MFIYFYFCVGGFVGCGGVSWVVICRLSSSWIMAFVMFYRKLSIGFGFVCSIDKYFIGFIFC